ACEGTLPGGVAGGPAVGNLPRRGAAGPLRRRRPGGGADAAATGREGPPQPARGSPAVREWSCRPLVSGERLDVPGDGLGGGWPGRGTAVLRCFGTGGAAAAATERNGDPLPRRSRRTCAA